MKKKILLNALLVLGLGLTSCTKEEPGPNAIDLLADIDEISNVAQTGSWQISRFINSGNEKTISFTEYSFSFNADGSLLADSRTSHVAGTWSVITENNNDNIVVGSTDNIDENVSNNNEGGNGANNDNSEVSPDDNNNGGNLNDNANSVDEGNDEVNGHTEIDNCNNCVSLELFEVLTGCSEWFVDKLERNDEDLEEEYANYLFDFSEDGTLNAKTESTTYSGTWESNGSGNNITVIINVPNLEELNDIWNLHEIELENDERKIDLRIDGDDRLRFKNRCATSAKKALKVAINTNYNNLSFNIFFANPASFTELNSDWNILLHTDVKIELSRIGIGNTDLLTFEKN